MVLKKAIRVSEWVWKELNAKKPLLEQREKDFYKEHPEEGPYVPAEITANMVIADLLVDYDMFHSVEYKEKQQKNIDDNYVPKKLFEELYEENRVGYEQDKKTINFLQEELKKSFAVEEDIKSKMKNQSDIDIEIRRKISDRDIEINGFKNNINVLVQQQEQLDQSLLDIRNRYNELVEKYNYNREYTDNECIEKTGMYALFYVCRFLFKYKKQSPFSFEQINKALWDKSRDDIRRALNLSYFPVVPIVMTKTQDGIRFQYDRHYLRTPLAQVLGFQ